MKLQLRHTEALRKSYELLQENDYNVINLRKSLQASHLNMLNAKKQLENAEIQVNLLSLVLPFIHSFKLLLINHSLHRLSLKIVCLLTEEKKLRQLK